jgi:hypothetical protein
MRVKTALADDEGDPAAELHRAMTACLHRVGNCIAKTIEDMHDGFWRGIDKMLYG